MARIFLSYARVDADSAKRLADALTQAGHDVWWDREIHAGSRFTSEIDKALREAQAIVVLWTENSVESAWVQDEAAEGRDSGRLIPVSLDGVRPPLGFRQYQSIQLDEGSGQDQQFRDVLSAIEKVVRDRQPHALVSSQPGAAGEHSICVLPFVNMSGDPEQEYFSDGITEDIITDLSKVSALSVIARNTAFTFKGKSSDVEVARTLGVSHMLEGSVRKAGNRVRITAQLVDGRKGNHLWAERYDRELTDIFEIQDEISRAIVDALRVKLRPSEKRAIENRGTANVEAYDYYLKGRQFFHNTTRNYLNLARRMFEKAVELDPHYARAHAGLVGCDTRLNEWYAAGIPTEEILAIADKALELEPGLAEAHAARGAALADAERHAEAETAFQHALELDPNSYDALYSYGRYSMTVGKTERAADLFIRANEIEPEDPQAPLIAHIPLRKLGRIQEAENYARLGLKLAEKALQLHPESSRPAQLGACVLAAMGEKEEAKEWLAHALAIDPDDNAARYNAACCLAQIGETDRALDLLEIWAKHRGSEAGRWMLADPDIDPLRNHPRYKALLDAAK